MNRSPNGLVGFTNCLLVQEDGTLLHCDLWVDEDSGLIVDAKVRNILRILVIRSGTSLRLLTSCPENILPGKEETRKDGGPWGEHSEVPRIRAVCAASILIRMHWD